MSHGIGVGYSEGKLATAATRARGRLNRVPRPQAEHHARVQCEHGEGRRGLDRGLAQEVAIKGSAGRWAVYVVDNS
jgi:hypothetical protein